MSDAAVFPEIGTPRPDLGNNPLPGTQDRHVFTQPPSGPFPSEELSKINYKGVEEFGASLTDLTNKVVIPAVDKSAAEEGAQSVSRDPNTGQIIVAPARGDFFPWDKAYMDAQGKAYQVEAASDIHNQLFTLAQQNASDPEAFQKAADQYRRQYVSAAPEPFRADLDFQSRQLIGQFNEGIFKQKMVADVADAKQGTLNEFESAKNDVAALARQNGMETDAGKAAMQRAIAATDRLVSNPLFGYGKADQEKDIAGLQGLAHAEAVIGDAIRTGRTEGEQAGLDKLHEHIWDPALSLTPAERTSYESNGRVQIREDAAATRQANSDAERNLLYKLDDAYSMAVTTGKQNLVDPNEVVRVFGPARGGQILEHINSGMAIYAENKFVATATPQQLAQHEAQLRTKLANPPPSAPDLQTVTNAIYGQESTFGANAGPSIDGSSIGPMQIKPDTFKRYAKPGENINNPADNRAVGQRILADYYKKFGGDPGRIATAYFSGEGNVAPAGSATPYIHDTHDANQKYVSSYVSDVLGRVGANPAAQNYKTNVIEYQAFQQAQVERQKALAADPEGYIERARPDIATKGANALKANDALGFQNVVRDSLQNQRDLGVLSPRVLSKDRARTFVQMFNNPSDPTKAADSMSGLIGNIQAQYGPYAPQVMTELQKAGLPPEASALVLTQGTPAAARIAGAINAMGKMGKDLNEGRQRYFENAPGNTDITKAIPQQMDDYRNSLVGTGGDGAVKVDATSHALNLYAHALAYEGKGAPDAAAQAYKDLIGSKYNFVDGYRVPHGVDTGAVRYGANLIRNTLKASDLAPQPGLPAGTDRGTAQELSRKILSQRGVWVTRTDDKGMRLVWPGDAGYVPAYDAHGHEISYSWAALSEPSRNPTHIQNAQDAAREALARGAR